MSTATPGSIVLASSMKELEALATRVSKSSLIPDAYRGKPDDCYVAMLMGSELGVGPMQSLQNIDVTEGRPQARARLKKTLAMRHPLCEYFRMVESTATKATYETKRRNNPKPTSFTYTIEMATQAGLTRKPNWMKNPTAMLLARAEGALADIEYSDATLGLPPEEYYDEPEASRIDTTTKVVDVTPAQPNVNTRGEEVKAILEKKKVEAAAESAGKVEDVELKPDPPAPAAPKEEEKKKSERKMKMQDCDASGAPIEAKPEEKKPEPVKVEPAQVTQFPKPEEKKADPAPLPSDYFEKATALAKLRGLTIPELKAKLKECGALGPKSVTAEVYAKLEAMYPAAREPGEDREEAPGEKKEDLF